MKWVYYKPLTTYLLLISSLALVKTVDDFRTIVYVSDDSTYHTLKILYGGTSASPDHPTTNFKVSVKRDGAGADKTGSGDTKYYDDNSKNRKYMYFLVRNDFTHEWTRPFVISELATGCDDTVPKLTFKIKFFTCIVEAQTYYTSATTPKYIYNGVTGVIGTNPGAIASDDTGNIRTQIATCPPPASPA